MAVGAWSEVDGVWIVALSPKIEKPLTRSDWSWKPEPPPIVNCAEPVMLNVGVEGKLPFESGMLMLTLAVGTLTLSWPVGDIVNWTAPWIVKTCEALMVRSWSGVDLAVGVVAGREHLLVRRRLEDDRDGRRASSPGAAAPSR